MAGKSRGHCPMPLGCNKIGRMRRSPSKSQLGHVSNGADTGQRNTTPMNMKRMRGRGGNRHGGGPFRHGSGGGGGGGSDRQPLNRNHVFDSNGPDMRLRGTSQQLFEKYLQLGRDATSGGDRVMAELYFQHAEHYFRILNAMNQAATQNQPTQQRRYQSAEGGEGESNDSGDMNAQGGRDDDDADAAGGEPTSEAREPA